MYTPEAFAENDPQAIDQMIDLNPLAVLVAQGPSGLMANHIPMLKGASGRLIGHVALANDIHAVLEDGQEVLAIFKGEGAYISPNWYPSKAEHHKHVPTWNYMVVHVHGRIHFSHDEGRKRSIVGRLTSVMERRMNGDTAWRMADAPKDYMEHMLAGIVGFEIEIDRIAAKSKLSQNREALDHASVAEVMETSGLTAMANAMKGS